MEQSSLNILLIDDDDICQFVSSKTIEYSKFPNKIFSFSNGADALQFIESKINEKEELPDIIFLDVNMPYMNGNQFLEAFHALEQKMHKEISIYMVSASENKRDYENFKRYKSIKGYIIKPIRIEKFEEIFSTLNV